MVKRIGHIKTFVQLINANFQLQSFVNPILLYLAIETITIKVELTLIILKFTQKGGTELGGWPPNAGYLPP